MGYFYFDESIHDQGGFITGCAIYSESDLNQKISGAISQSGLNPEFDEHKSGFRIAGDEKRLLLREKLYSIFHKDTKFGLVFVPREERDSLFPYGLKLINKIIEKNGLKDEVHEVYFDEGISDRKSVDKYADLVKNVNVHINQDSKVARGIQIADLIAHTCSMMLRESLGLLKKSVRAGESSGYDPDIMIEIGFSMWATIRYNLFQGQNDIEPERAICGFTNVAEYGLLISSSFKPDLRDAIESRFATNYLGCIH